MPRLQEICGSTNHDPSVDEPGASLPQEHPLWTLCGPLVTLPTLSEPSPLASAAGYKRRGNWEVMAGHGHFLSQKQIARIVLPFTTQEERASKFQISLPEKEG